MSRMFKRPPPPPQINPGEDTFLAWDPRNQNVEHAQTIARQIRELGGRVLGCTLDAEVRRGSKCPVCGQAGLA